MNKKRILLITFIAVFIVIIGVSYARFESDVNFGGGTDITGSMWTSEDSAIKLIVNGNLTMFIKVLAK